MQQVLLSMLVAGLSVIGAGCSGDDAADTTSSPTSAPSTSMRRTSTTADTSATASTTTVDPTTTPGSLPTTAPAATTAPPPTSTGVLHPVPDGTPPPQRLDQQGGASGLRSTVFCDPVSPSSGAATLTWIPSGSAQLLAVSTLPDGFESGRYTVTDELAADTTTHQISPIEPGGIYYWRVLTLSAGTWLSSVQESFTGPVCVLDSP